MKPAAFEYHRPTSLDEALTLLAEFGARGIDAVWRLPNWTGGPLDIAGYEMGGER